MSLSLVKAELKKRGLPVKGKKASLMARLIVVLKQAENLSQSVKGSGKSTFLQKDQLCYLKRAEKLTFCIHFS